MSREHVGHSAIVRFAEDRINLPRDKAKIYRDQARRLREKLDGYLADHPDFSLKKMLLSGSLAKSTALRSLNDIDLACYVGGVEASTDVPVLLDYLAEKLRTAFPNFKRDQVKPQTFSVTVSFRGTGLDVDVVPIIYNDDPDWYGLLVSQQDGALLETCIPRHLEFSLKRRKADADFAQVVRLLKSWAQKEKAERDGFRFKSFMIELILSKLADEGQDLSDYPEAMQAFFTYVARSGLRERVFFEDYFPASNVGVFQHPVQIIDPVNPKNNAASLYTEQDARVMVDAALDAGDAIDAALVATTKGDTVRYWQKVFGSAFSA